MTEPNTDPALSLEEYRALRATIRERGTTRNVVTLITFVSWAASVFAAQAVESTVTSTLVPLMVLVAGFEIIVAMHVGVERIGRYLQANYEPASGLPRWETTAMSFGSVPAASGGPAGPLMAGIFAVAAVVNLVPVLLDNMTGGGSPVEILVFGTLHLLFVLRLLQANRFAATQRARELAWFESIRSGAGR